MKFKRICPALFAIALGLTIPVLSSCSDDDDDKSSKSKLECYSADAAKTYLHDVFAESFDKLQNVNVSETQFGALQNIYSYFHETYATYSIDGDSQVFTVKELSEKLKKVFNGEVSKDDAIARLDAVAGTYTPDEATKKWVKTEETPGNITLVFKDKNGKDAKINVNWTKFGEKNGAIAQCITGENLDFTIYLLDVTDANHASVLKVKLGRMGIASTTMTTSNSEVKTTIVNIDNKPIVTSTKTSSGKLLNDAVLGNNEYEKVLDKTNYLDKIIVVRTNKDYQAVKTATSKKYASQEEQTKAIADALNANVNSDIYDTQGKYLFNVKYVANKDGDNSLLVNQFSAADGTTFMLDDFFYDVDVKSTFYERVNHILQIIKNMGVDMGTL